MEMTAWTMTSLPSGSMPGPVAAQDHGQPVRGEADAAQAPQVVVVERGRPQATATQPSRPGVGPLADLQAGERVVGDWEAA